MANVSISGLLAATPLTGTELLEVSQLSSTVTISAGTISALASDNSFNDSGNGFVAAGFAAGDRVKVTGFTGNVANNIFVGKITALTAGKMTIGGADGDVIVDDAAGESVTISKWVSRRTTAQEVADLAGSGGGGGSARTLLATVTTTAGQTAVTLMSSIPQTYKKLTVEILGGTTGTSTSTSDHICLRFNNDSGSNYKYTGLSTFPTGTGVFGSNGTTSVHAAATSTGVAGQKPTACKFEIPNYAQSLDWHSIFIDSVFYQGNVGIAQAPGSGIYAPASPAAISRIDAVVSGNAFSTGTVIELWGE